MIDPQAPVALSRIDGWSPAVQEAFVAALIETGSVRMAAAAVGMHFTSAYRLRARDTAFALAWNAARAMAYARLRDEAMQRGLHGTEEDVWHQGERVGTRVVHDNRLLMQLLGHLHAESVSFSDRRFERSFEDRRLDLVGERLDTLVDPAPPPAVPPPPPASRPAATRLRPAKGWIRADGRPAPLSAEPRQPRVRIP